MKQLFLFLPIFLFGNISITHASLGVTCETELLHAIENPYENIYHEEVPDRMFHLILDGCYEDNKFSNAMNEILRQGIPPFQTGTLLQIIPVYHPRFSYPMFLISVGGSSTGTYTQMLSSPGNYWAFYNFPCGGLDFSDNRQKLHCFYPHYTGTERRELYFLSQSEPYRSAPIIQFYVYRLGLLLVARDESGEIAHWDYEKKEYSFTEDDLRYFLGDKWYHP